MKGILINRLIVTSDQKPPAELRFGPGVNVISGPSDTGKSHSYELIEYLLGRKAIPSTIPEARGYKDCFLEVTGNSGEIFTVKRSLLGGALQLYKGEYREGLSDSDGEELAQKHGNKGKSYSEFYLGLLGVQNKALIKNKRGTKVSLSFPYLRKLAMVSEEDIIQKISPIHTGDNVQKTAEMSLFRYLLTGVDYSGLPSPKNPKEEEIRQNLSKQMFDLMRKFSVEKVGAKDTGLLEVRADLSNLNSKKQAMDLATREHSKEHDKLVRHRRSLEKAMRKRQSRVRTIAKLKARFQALQARYKLDLERLDAIAEGSYLFSTGVAAANCPWCGSLLDGNPHAHALENHEKVASAVAKEKERVALFLSDIGSSLAELNVEANDLSNKLQEAEKEVEHTTYVLDAEIQGSLSKLYEQSEEVQEKIQELEQKQLLLEQFELLEKTFVNPQDEAVIEEIVSSVSASDADKFLDHMEILLASWRFPDSQRVGFSEKKQDVVIGGKDRGSFGKGFRAIAHAAFLISAMEASADVGSGHPLFVIMDSPLVTYRKKDVPEGEAVPEDMKEAFYRDLITRYANREDRQIIIFENEDPPEEIETKMNYVHFTKNSQFGRYGFYPG